MLGRVPSNLTNYPFQTVSHGGLLEWDVRARITRNRLLEPHKYASIQPHIRLSRVAIGTFLRNQQTTDHGPRAFTAVDCQRVPAPRPSHEAHCPGPIGHEPPFGGAHPLGIMGNPNNARGKPI